MSILKGQYRKDVQTGTEVEIVLKKDQRTGKTVRGLVKDILTNTSFHPHGVKVRLEDGRIGRVKRIVSTGREE